MALYSVAPGTGNLDPDVVNYFLRSDTPDGLARNAQGTIPPPPQATQKFLQLLAAGVIQPVGTAGQQHAASIGYTPAGPTDPNYIGGQVAAGTNWADIAFGQIPNQPANTQATIQMRDLLLRSVQTQRQIDIAQQNADLAAQLGKSADALAWKTQADNLALDKQKLDQQADQFAQQHGLEAELGRGRLALEGELGRGQLGVSQGELALKQAQFGLDTSKYTSELAANPKNLIQSALFQGSRMPGGFQPNATAFGGNANTPVGQATFGAQPGQGMTEQFQTMGPESLGQGGAQTGANPYGNQMVPVPATVNALLTGARVPKIGMTQAPGSMMTLNQLQYDPSMRLNYSNMGAASLRNTLANPTDAAMFDSLARAQGQETQTFAGALGSSLPKKSADVTLGY